MQDTGKKKLKKKLRDKNKDIWRWNKMENKLLRNIIGVGLFAAGALASTVVHELNSPEIMFVSTLDKNPGARTMRVYRTGFFNGDVALKELYDGYFVPMDKKEITEKWFMHSGHYTNRAEADRARSSIYANK